MSGNHKPVWNILVVLILILSAVWIWTTKDPDFDTTGGEIPAPHKGFLAPNFNLTTLDGESIKLSDLRGHPILINVWASWCQPCRTEMPAIQRLYDDYHPQGFQVLAVNSTSQDDLKNVQNFIELNQLTFPVLLIPSGDG